MKMDQKMLLAYLALLALMWSGEKLCDAAPPKKKTPPPQKDIEAAKRKKEIAGKLERLKGKPKEEATATERTSFNQMVFGVSSQKDFELKTSGGGVSSESSKSAESLERKKQELQRIQDELLQIERRTKEREREAYARQQEKLRLLAEETERRKKEAEARRKEFVSSKASSATSSCSSTSCDADEYTYGYYYYSDEEGGSELYYASADRHLSSSSNGGAATSSMASSAAAPKDIKATFQWEDDEPEPKPSVTDTTKSKINHPMHMKKPAASEITYFAVISRENINLSPLRGYEVGPNRKRYIRIIDSFSISKNVNATSKDFGCVPKALLVKKVNLTVVEVEESERRLNKLRALAGSIGKSTEIHMKRMEKENEIRQEEQERELERIKAATVDKKELAAKEAEKKAKQRVRIVIGGDLIQGGGGGDGVSSSEGNDNKGDSASASGGKNATSVGDGTLDGEDAEDGGDESSKDRKMSFKEKMESKKEDRRKAQELEDQTIPKIQRGSSCESLICGSCKLIVEEFAKNVHKLTHDMDYKTLDDVLDGVAIDWGDDEGFYGDDEGGGGGGGGDEGGALDSGIINLCKRPEIDMMYTDFVKMHCEKFVNRTLGYREALLLPFEEDGVWPRIAERKGLWAKQRRICESVGACNTTTFEFSVEPQDEYQSQWEAGCFVCHRVARDMEELASLLRPSMWDTHLSRVVLSEVCDRLQLPAEYDAICREMTGPGSKHRTEIEWALRENADAALRGVREELDFAESMCRTINYCDEFLDPDLYRIKRVTKLLKPEDIVFA